MKLKKNVHLNNVKRHTYIFLVQASLKIVFYRSKIKAGENMILISNNTFFIVSIFKNPG